MCQHRRPNGHVLLGDSPHERQHRCEHRHTQLEVVNYEALQGMRGRARNAVVRVRERAHEEAPASLVDDELFRNGKMVKEWEHIDRLRIEAHPRIKRPPILGDRALEGRDVLGVREARLEREHLQQSSAVISVSRGSTCSSHQQSSAVISVSRGSTCSSHQQSSAVISSHQQSSAVMSGHGSTSSHGASRVIQFHTSPGSRVRVKCMRPPRRLPFSTKQRPYER